MWHSQAKVQIDLDTKAQLNLKLKTVRDEGNNGVMNKGSLQKEKKNPKMQFRSGHLKTHLFLSENRGVPSYLAIFAIFVQIP